MSAAVVDESNTAFERWYKAPCTFCGSTTPKSVFSTDMGDGTNHSGYRCFSCKAIIAEVISPSCTSAPQEPQTITATEEKCP